MIHASKQGSRKYGGPLILLVGGLLCGCRNNYQAPPPKPPVNLPNGALNVTLAMKPSVLRQMDPVTLKVKVADGHGAPVNGVTVGADLVMPSMDMGRNTVRFRSAGPGVYSGGGRFSMDGEWSVVVTAVKGKDKTVKTFPVRVR